MIIKAKLFIVEIFLNTTMSIILISNCSDKTKCFVNVGTDA